MATFHKITRGVGTLEFSMVAAPRKLYGAYGALAVALACAAQLWLALSARAAATAALAATATPHAAVALLPRDPMLALWALLCGGAALWVARFAWCDSSVRKESIALLGGLGLQLATTTWSGRSSTRLVPLEAVEALLINEGVSVWKVTNYLAVAVKGESDLAIVFTALNPPLDVLREVYCDLSERMENSSAALAASPPASPSLRLRRSTRKTSRRR